MLVTTRKQLMMTAAVVSSFRAPRMRPASSESEPIAPGPPLIWGITATPVSKPERPRASLGKTSRAMPIASVKPRRNTAASRASSTRVMSTSWPCRNDGRYGFSTAWAVASAADSVIVTRRSVAAKPSSTSTKTLPAHHGRIRSSIAVEPSPLELSRATRR